MFRTSMLSLCLCLCLLCIGAPSAMSAGPHFVVAHDATWPPMEFMDQQRNIVGYSVDYIDAIAKEAGFTVEHLSVAWDGIFAGLARKNMTLSPLP